MHRGQRRKGASKKVRTWHPQVGRCGTSKTVAFLLRRQSNWAWHALLVA